MRYCRNRHVSEERDCVQATIHGFVRPGLHCWKCGLLTHEVGDMSTLTDSMFNVLALNHAGLRGREIGAKLRIQSGTVKVLFSQLYTALGLSNRVQLALLWERRLVASPETARADRASTVLSFKGAA